MIEGLYIFVDDDFIDPVYADPASEDLEPDLWEGLCTHVTDALEGDGKAEGTVKRGEVLYGWRTVLRNGLTFAAVVTDDVSPKHLLKYLQELQQHYYDEVDDLREPEREGVSDIVVDVIPVWEDED